MTQTYAIAFSTPNYDHEVELIKAQSAKEARRLFMDQFDSFIDPVTIKSVEPYQTMEDLARIPGSAAWCEGYGDNRD